MSIEASYSGKGLLITVFLVVLAGTVVAGVVPGADSDADDSWLDNKEAYDAVAKPKPAQQAAAQAPPPGMMGGAPPANPSSNDPCRQACERIGVMAVQSGEDGSRAGERFKQCLDMCTAGKANSRYIPNGTCVHKVDSSQHCRCRRSRSRWHIHLGRSGG